MPSKTAILLFIRSSNRDGVIKLHHICAFLISRAAKLHLAFFDF